MCSVAIRRALNEFLIDQVIDYEPAVSSEPSDNPIWFLKIASPDERERLQALTPRDKAIVSILRGQNEQGRIGRIKKELLRAQLREQGFSDEDLRVLYVKDKVDTFQTCEDEGWVDWCYLIPEYEKTEEYKRWEEEMMMSAIERESMILRMQEEMEKEDARKQKRKARAAKKTSRTQSI